MQKVRETLRAPLKVALKHETLYIKRHNIIKLIADGTYTWIHCKNRDPVLSSKNLAFYYRQLNHFPFYKSHRSSVVNISEIVSIQSNHRFLRLTNEITAKISRKRFKGLKDMLERL